MSAAPVMETLEETASDAVLSRLTDTGAWLAELVDERDTAAPVSPAARIDRITMLERLQAGLEAAKNAEMVAFARAQALEQVQLGVHPRQAERGIADQIGLACRVSPTEGSRRLHTARDLVLDMPQLLELLARGGINAGTARRITDKFPPGPTYTHRSRRSARQKAAG